MTAPPAGFDGERRARLLAPPGVLLIATGVLLGGWPAPPLVVAGAVLLVLAATSPTDGVLLIGPFARAELLAASRRRIWRWRAVYVLLCGLALFLSVLLPPSLDTRARKPSPSVYTQGFFLGVVGVLASYLTHLTLAVVAPVAAEEREKKRWEMLLTTDLRNREVLFGKMAGRLPGVFEPLLAVLPVLALLPVLGGVPPVLVGVAATVTLSLIGGFAALATYASVTQPTGEKALNAARGLAWGYVGLSAMLISFAGYPPVWNFPSSAGLPSPVEFRHVVEWVNAGNPMGTGVLAFSLGIGRSASVEDDLVKIAQRCAAFWLLVGGLVGLLSVAMLRGEVLPAPPTPGKGKGKLKAVPVRPPVPDLAVSWWAEYGHLNAWAMRKVGNIGWWTYLRWFVYMLVFFGVCRGLAARDPGGWPNYKVIADMVGMIGLVGWAVAVPMIPLFQGAQVIARERAADTLSGLLLTDLTPRDVVWQKWWGVLRPMRHAYAFGVLWAVVVVATGGIIPWWAVPLILLMPALLAPCWAAVGLAASAHASTPAKAQRNLSAVVFGGGYGVLILFSVVMAMLPNQTAKQVFAALAGVAALLAQPLLGWLAFRYAVRRLDREHG